METIWERIRSFIRESYQKRFAASFGGCLLGFIHSRYWGFVGFPLHVAHWVVDAWVIVKGFIIAFITSLITSAGAYLFQKHIKGYLDRKTKKKHLNNNRKGRKIA